MVNDQQAKTAASIIAFIAVLLLFLLGSLTSCKSKEEIAQKRLNRIAADFPQLFRDTVITDTVEVYWPLVSVDSVVVSVPGDTVTITRDRLTVRYVKLAGDTVWLEGTCAADTIVKEVRVTLPRAVITEKVKVTPWWVWLVIGALAVMLILSLARR